MAYDPEYWSNYRQKNRAKLLAQRAERRTANREKCRADKRRWHSQNKDRVNTKRRADYAETKEEKNAVRRAKYHENPVPILEAQKRSRPKINARRTQQRRANRDVVNAKQRADRLKRLAHVRERDRLRRAKDLEKGRAYARRKRAENPAHFRLLDRNRRNNPEQYQARIRTQHRRRRAAKANAPINDLTHAQWLEIQEAQDHRCYYCGKRHKGHLTQDHLTPLSKGGSHTVHNVIAACQSCNSRKGTKKPSVPVQPFLLTVALSRKRKVP